jgi:hypothetical protein
MAAAKIGLNVIDVDTKINTVPQVREFLSISNCRMIVFDSEPKDGDSDRLLLLRKAIPEFYECNNFIEIFFVVISMKIDDFIFYVCR